MLNHHHIFWQRKMYNKGYLKDLRNYYYCIVDIEKDSIHNNIHNSIKYIPAPKASNAKYALEQLKILDDYKAIKNEDSFEKRLLVLMALFECVENETFLGLKKQLEIVCRYDNSL